MSCEKYRDELREAARLKLKSHAAPTPEIMTETDKELRAVIQDIAKHYDKPYKTVQGEVYEIFSQEWERHMLQEERKKESKDRQRIFRNMDIQARAKERT